jgi:hypothetical protein
MSLVAGMGQVTGIVLPTRLQLEPEMRTLGRTLEGVGVVDVEYHCAKEVHASAEAGTEYRDPAREFRENCRFGASLPVHATPASMKGATSMGRSRRARARGVSDPTTDTELRWPWGPAPDQALELRTRTPRYRPPDCTRRH